MGDHIDAISIDDLETTAKTGNTRGDFAPMVIDGLSQIPFKMMFILYVLYLVFNSDIFNERVLGKIDGAIEFGSQPSSYGVAVVGLLFVIFYATFQVLSDKKII